MAKNEDSINALADKQIRANSKRSKGDISAGKDQGRRCLTVDDMDDFGYRRNSRGSWSLPPLTGSDSDYRSTVFAGAPARA